MGTTVDKPVEFAGLIPRFDYVVSLDARGVIALLYERRSASHRFDEVAPLVADDAVFWFNDGSFSGRDSIRKAFERTWALEIQEENYRLDDIRWLIKTEGFAACILSFHWTGMVKGSPRF